MTRARLPARRPSRTHELRWADSNGQPTKFTMTVGFFLDGRPGEVFADGPKTGSAMQALLADACVILSVALQHGITPAELLHSMGRTPVSETQSAPASVIGAITEVLIQRPGDEGGGATR